MSSISYPGLSSEQIGEAIRAYMEPHCPACGVEKDLRNDPFCDACLGRLPQELCEAVCENQRYIEAYHAAMMLLKPEKQRSRSVSRDTH